MKKKIFAAVIASVMALSLAACGTSTTFTAASEASSIAYAIYKVNSSARPNSVTGVRIIW